MEKILVFADVHIGFEEALNKQGIFLPRTMFKEIKENIAKIFDNVEKELGQEVRRAERIKDEKKKKNENKKELKKDKEKNKINEIIILGDLKHEFGEISRQEWLETMEFLDMLKEKCKKIILIKGNHDTILEPIAKRKELKIRDFYIKDGVCFLHGHKQYLECLDKKIKMIVLGHRHPAVTLRENVKSERYKCFLVGKWKGKEIIILPSMFPLIEGSDIVNENEYGMAFNFDYGRFGVYIVVEGKVYEFGKMEKLR